MKFYIFLLFSYFKYILALSLHNTNTKSFSSGQMKEKSLLKKNNFEFSKLNMNTEMFARFYEKKLNNHQEDDDMRSSLYRDLNETFVVKDSYTFRKSKRKWDYKILDKQLEEVFGTLLYKQQDRMTVNGVRNYMELFMNQYQKCDKDEDNVLNLGEFISCMTSDPYFSQIVPPPSQYAAMTNYSTPTVFYTAMFNVLNERYEDYVNFVGYMRIRLAAFSWRECSIFSPFLEEADFECALEIIAKFKTQSRTSARNIFKLTLELSNNPNLRNIDFLTYFIIADTVRLYGKINGKEDNDITRSEFNLALDDNILPIRYNQDIINQMFKLIDDYDRQDQGIDLQSFIFYDFSLQLFTFYKKARPYYLSFDEFQTSIFNALFPNRTLNEIYFIPQYSLSASSYQMYQYINITQFIPEGDYLYKFLETDSQVELKRKNYPISPIDNLGQNFYKVAVNMTQTLQLIFNTLDYDLDGWINFYDFGTFMQVAYTFAKRDEYNKGKIPAGQLFEIFKDYADFPYISYRVREKSERFNLLDQNLYLDMLSALQVIKIDDIVRYFVRKTDKQNVNEIELKKILSRVNMQYLPDTYLHRCLRGVDSNNLPRYDWECSFLQGINQNLQYFEAMNNYKEVQNNKMSMLNTVFYNVDPNYK